MFSTNRSNNGKSITNKYFYPNWNVNPGGKPPPPPPPPKNSVPGPPLKNAWKTCVGSISEVEHVN